jgi:nitrogen fixation protein FixH
MATKCLRPLKQASTPNQEIKMRISWPTGIIIAFTLFCSFMIGFTVYSVRNQNELVDRDYYTQELKYQEVINHKNNLEALEEKVQLTQEPEGLWFELPELLQQADSGTVDFYRPNDQRRDFEISWDAFRAAGFRVSTDELGTGKWVITLKAYKGGTGYFSEHRVQL